MKRLPRKLKKHLVYNFGIDFYKFFYKSRANKLKLRAELKEMGIKHGI